MKRVRWLNATWPKSVKKLMPDFKLHAFTEGKTSGFFIDRLRENHIAGRYVEQKEVNEIAVDPFGKEMVFKRVFFEQVEFSAFDELPAIEIYDAPRGLQGFICRLLEICNFDLTVTYLQVDLLKWIEGLQKLIDAPIIVETVQITGYEFEKEVSGKILLKSDRDVRPVLSKFSKNKSLNISDARIRFEILKQPVTILFHSNGATHFPDLHEDYLLPILRRTLRDAIIA